MSDELSNEVQPSAPTIVDLLKAFEEGTLAEAANDAYARRMEEVESKGGRAFRFRPCFSGYDEVFDYLIKGYLPARALGVLYGASGSYKSFHALSWAAHVALGRNWNKCRVKKAGVLYIAGEGGIGVPRRIKALADRYNEGQPIPNLFRMDHAVHFGESRQVTQLINALNQCADNVDQKFGLIVLDTLARCFSGDENKAEEMGKFITACDRLKAETGATVLVIHHSGVMDPNRARGSSALRAAADFEYRAERAKAESPGVVVIGTKSKDEKEAPSQVFWLAEHPLFTDADGDQVVSLACADEGEAPPEGEPGDAEVKALTPFEESLYQAVRARMATGEPTELAVLRDDMRQQYGEKARKSFRRWLNGCIDKQVLYLEGETLITSSPLHELTEEAANEALALKACN